MPIYEYECTNCGKTQEVIQKFSDAPLETCSTCSGKLQKLMSQSSFHLKGTGWYVTDYANKSKSASSKQEKAQSEPSKGSTSDSGKEATPAPESKSSSDS